VPTVNFHITPLLALKTLGSFILSILGMYYINVGQKERDIKVMAQGAALVLLSLFLFI
jgi:hypothetical protein